MTDTYCPSPSFALLVLAFSPVSSCQSSPIMAVRFPYTARAHHEGAGDIASLRGVASPGSLATACSSTDMHTTSNMFHHPERNA
jgi:hypothetical protein